MKSPEATLTFLSWTLPEIMCSSLKLSLWMRAMGKWSFSARIPALLVPPSSGEQTTVSCQSGTFSLIHLQIRIHQFWYWLVKRSINRRRKAKLEICIICPIQLTFLRPIAIVLKPICKTPPPCEKSANCCLCPSCYSALTQHEWLENNFASSVPKRLAILIPWSRCQSHSTIISFLMIVITKITIFNNIKLRNVPQLLD